MNTSTPSTRDPDNIRSQIDATRERMDGNLDALSDRLKGKHLLDEVLGFFRTPDGQNKATEITRRISQSTEQAVRSVGDSIKANPIPLLLIGAGIGWAVYAHNKKTRESSKMGWGDQDADMRRSPSSGSNGGVSETLNRTMDKTKELAGDAMARTQAMAREGKEQVTRAVAEHPLSVGLGCLAAGIVAGILIPTPAPAARVMAAPAARLREQAERVGQELVERGQQVAETATEALAGSLEGSSDKGDRNNS